MSTKTEYEFTVDQAGVALTWQGQTLEIESDDLREGGWVRREDIPELCDRNHCDEGECPGCVYCDGDGNLPTGGGEALKRWHDEESGHIGPFRFCYAEPCKSVSDALGVVRG